MLNMKSLVIAVLALAIPTVFSYDEKYDKLDVDKIIGDDSLFDAYIQCLLDKGPCSVEHSADFRKLVPEVIADACAKCTPLQRTNVRKTVKALQEKKPQEFKEFRAKYDPKGEYEQAFAAFMVATD
ncbi:ejaculatory bulb-specific protein 3-like [Pectinophora gossypiella]|uniref:ejaculatory bulb-specific protein 3-like n=1 Tax=Pectinophora gossypiella TaxID=13191 RepID=UPI00214EE207|nr:ejaculatory bulb-specific protein 3-like [Pectinophora gossypiella]